MMVGYDPDKETLTKKQLAIVSSATGFLSRFVVQPFDVVKIRFQLQYEPISRNSTNSKYHGLFDAFKTIYKEERIFAFWKGLLTGQLLSGGYTFAQFTSFELLTEYAFKFSPNLIENNKYKTITHFMCGGIAASIATLFIQPVDTIRTRLVAQGEPKTYRSLPHAVGSIYKHEGIRGFYKGLTPSIILVAPQSALTFSVYAFLNICWQKLNIDNKTLVLQSSINGALSGVVAKSVIFPFDVVKKRLQIQGFDRARVRFGKVVHFTGVFDCLYKTIKEERFLGLYKGYFPGMLKAGVSTGAIFLIYEQIVIFTRFLKRHSFIE